MVVVDGVPVADAELLPLTEEVPPVMWNGSEYWKVGEADVAVESRTILNP